MDSHQGYIQFYKQMRLHEYSGIMQPWHALLLGYAATACAVVGLWSTGIRCCGVMQPRHTIGQLTMPGNFLTSNSLHRDDHRPLFHAGDLHYTRAWWVCYVGEMWTKGWRWAPLHYLALVSNCCIYCMHYMPSVYCIYAHISSLSLSVYW